MDEPLICCRNCGGPLPDLDPAGEFVTCPHCGGDNLVADLLGNQLPVPYNCNGEISANKPDKLSVELHAQEETDFLRYIEDCRNRGLSVDAREDPISYTAYNGEGCKANLRYYAAKKLLRIDLAAPIDF